MSKDSPFEPQDEKPDPPSYDYAEPTSPFEASPFEKGANVEEAQDGATFSLLHVFFWTAGIGLAMSVDTTALMPTAQMNDPAMSWMKTYMAVARVVTGLGMGPLIGMLPFWLIYRRKGVSFPYHPGHWLMMHYGASFLVNVIANWIQRATGTLPNFNPETMENPLNSMGPVYAAASASMLAGFIVALIAFRNLRHDRPIWRITFGILALQSGFGLFGSIVTTIGIYVNEAMMWIGIMTMGVFTGCIAWVYMILVVVAVIMDLVEKNRRDWLHWMPFILFLFMIVISLGGLIAGIAFMA